MEKIILILLAVAFVASPVSADIFFYGIPDYSAVVVPDRGYVHQGQNISQGNCYDLSGVYGFSGYLAYWEDSYDAGYTYPDKVESIDFGKMTCIDSKKFPVGAWYQWDGGCWAKDGNECNAGFGHGNTFAFRVVRPKINATENITVTTGMLAISDNTSTVEIPVEVAVKETSHADIVTPDVTPDANTSVYVITLPTTIPVTTYGTPEMVTPRASLGFLIPLAGLGVALFLRH